MVQEKGKVLLSSEDLAMLMFHLKQYRMREITIDVLVHTLKNMFDNEEKESLFTEIDELIFSEDLKSYDSLVFQKGKLFERVIEAINPSKEGANGINEDIGQYGNLEQSDFDDSLLSERNSEWISWKPKFPQYVRKCTRSFSYYEDTEPLLKQKVLNVFILIFM